MGLNLVAVERHLKPKRRERGTYRHFSRHRAPGAHSLSHLLLPLPYLPPPSQTYAPYPGWSDSTAAQSASSQCRRRRPSGLWHRARDKLCDLAMGLFQLRRCSTFSSRQSHVKS